MVNNLEKEAEKYHSLVMVMKMELSSRVHGTNTLKSMMMTEMNQKP